MNTDEIPTNAPSNWTPIINPLQVALLAKLIEESRELTSIAARCLEQGFDGLEPKTKKLNISSLEEEIADVLAMIDLAIDELGLNGSEIDRRRQRKMVYKRPWFDWLRAR